MGGAPPSSLAGLGRHVTVICAGPAVSRGQSTRNRLIAGIAAPACTVTVALSRPSVPVSARTRTIGSRTGRTCRNRPAVTGTITRRSLATIHTVDWPGSLTCPSTATSGGSSGASVCPSRGLVIATSAATGVLYWTVMTSSTSAPCASVASTRTRLTPGDSLTAVAKALPASVGTLVRSSTCTTTRSGWPPTSVPEMTSVSRSVVLTLSPSRRMRRRPRPSPSGDETWAAAGGSERGGRVGVSLTIAGGRDGSTPAGAADVDGATRSAATTTGGGSGGGGAGGGAGATVGVAGVDGSGRRLGAGGGVAFGIATEADRGCGSGAGAGDAGSDRGGAAAIFRGDWAACRLSAAASSTVTVGAAAATVSGIPGTGRSTSARGAVGCSAMLATDGAVAGSSAAKDSGATGGRSGPSSSISLARGGDTCISA